MSPAVRLVVLFAGVSIRAVAGTVAIHDFESGVPYHNNSKTSNPDGRCTNRAIAEAAVGGSACRVEIPACRFGFWQLTGLNGGDFAPHEPTHLVFWHRTTGAPLRLRVVLREDGGERWFAAVASDPGDWRREAIALADMDCMEGGKAERAFELPRLRVFQFQFGPLAEPRVLEIDGICLTSRPARARAELMDIPLDGPRWTEVGGRRTASLGGAWGFVPVAEVGEAPADGWRRMTIADRDVWKWNHWAKHSRDWADAKCGWYRRRLLLPGGPPRGRRLVVRFGAVHSEALVFVNSVEVAEHVGGLTPFEADVTEALRRGENELVVACRGPAAVLSSQAKGAMHRFHAGIWREVNLLSVPEAYIADVFVQTSVEAGTLRTSTRLANAGNRAQTVRVRHRVLDVDGRTGVDTHFAGGGRGVAEGGAHGPGPRSRAESRGRVRACYGGGSEDGRGRGAGAAATAPRGA